MIVTFDNVLLSLCRRFANAARIVSILDLIISTDVMHYVISLFSGYYLIIFRYMSGKRVVGSTAILEIRAAWNLPF